MTLDEAMVRVVRIAERRLEKAKAYADAAVEYAKRASSVDDVMHAAQREFLTDYGVRSLANAKAMHDDAEALQLVLDALPRTEVRPND